MKKIIFLIVITMIWCFSGCDNSTKQQEILENEETVTDSVVVKQEDNEVFPNSEDDSWKCDVAEKLYEEFCYFYNHKDDNLYNDEYYSKYNYIQDVSFANYYRIMASDRATGIEVYRDYISEDKYNYVLSKGEELNKIRFTEDMIFFGYSEHGLHYLAVSYTPTRHSLYSRPVADKVTGNHKESDFLSEMNHKASFLLHDLYVEDLSSKRDTIDVNVEFTQMDGPVERIVEKNYRLLLEGEGVLVKYGRKLVPEGVTEIKNKSWNLYATRSNISYIVHRFYVISNGEKTKLESTAPTP